jgi:hypothetical protein
VARNDDTIPLVTLEKVACFPIKTACTVFMQSLNKKAISRIHGRGMGWAFSPNTFVEDFSRSLLPLRLLSGQIEVEAIAL